MDTDKNKEEMRDALIKQLIKNEGLRLKPYTCTAGKLTIGIGRNLDDKGISEEEAMYLLKNDIEECEFQLNKELAFFKNLDMARQDVLLNMCFNLGINGLLGFKNTLAMIEAGNYEAAADNMLNSKWAYQVGDRAKELADIMRG